MCLERDVISKYVFATAVSSARDFSKQSVRKQWSASVLLWIMLPNGKENGSHSCCAFLFSNPLLSRTQSSYWQVLHLIRNHKLGGAAQFIASAEQEEFSQECIKRSFSSGKGLKCCQSPAILWIQNASFFWLMILKMSFEQVLEWHKTIIDFARMLLLYNYEQCQQERCKRSKLVALRDLKNQMCGTGDIKDWAGDAVATGFSTAWDIRKGMSVLQEGTLLSVELNSCSERVGAVHWPERCCSRLCPRGWLPDTGTSRTSPRTVSRWWATGKTRAVSEAEWDFPAVEEKTHQKISTSRLKLCWCSSCAG